MIVDDVMVTGPSAKTALPRVAVQPEIVDEVMVSEPPTVTIAPPASPPVQFVMLDEVIMVVEP